MKITPRVAMEVAAHEGLVRQAYKDSVGVWTWSVGITSASGHSVERYIGKPQPLETCLSIWIWVLEKYADDVRTVLPGLSEAQFAAALSFHYNTGAISRAGWVKKWKAGDVAGARKSFMDWRKPPEIIPRRQKERDLFFSGMWSSDGTMTEYTRLTKNHTPVWSSAKKIDVSAALVRLLNPTEPPHRPDVEPVPPAAASGFWAVLVKALASIFKRNAR